MQVTDAARENLNGAIEKIRQGSTEDAVFRIVEDQSSKLTLTIDTPGSRDVIFEKDGRTVLVVAEDVAQRCEGRTLDDDGKGNLMLI
jgi:hypothetical protein